MSRYAHVAGLEIGGGIYTWDTDRTMLYAVGVGAGLHDNLDELQFTTENTPGVAQQVIPGFATVMNMAGDFIEPLGWGGPGEYPVGMVHGEQSVTLLQPIPPAGTVLMRRRFEDVYDKGSGALVVMVTEMELPDGQPLGSTRMSLFVQGKGNFGGPRGPAGGSPAWPEPEREPDCVVSFPIGLNQSLIYRLMGDHREHGTVPQNARADGFERPVFYGLGSYGVACRALIKGLCGGDAARFGHMEVRFAKPVYPGDRLDTLIWRTDDGAQFRVMANGERISLDRGVFRYRA
jgi:hypothetical protein